MDVFIYFLFDSLFELENSPHEFSSMGNFKTIEKKEYFGSNSFFMSDVSLGIAFVVLEVLIATFPHPPPPRGSTRFHRNSDTLNFTNSSGNPGVSADLVWGGDGRSFCDFL